MELQKYLDTHKVSRDDLAAKIGTSPAYIYQIISGIRKPGIKTIAKIYKATNGLVGIADLRSEQL